MGHFPAGASMQSIYHYAQIINSNSFPLFDWGAKINQQKYGQATPPQIELGNIQTPTAMFVGSVDELGDPADARWARDQIKSLAHYEEIQGGHLTFMVGNDMSYFNRVLDLIHTHSIY